MKEQKLKRYRLGVSRTFPSTHPRGGEETYFVYKILTALFPNETLFPVTCNECGWESWSNLAEGGGQIADTGEYGDIYCPKCHSNQLDDTSENSFMYYKENENIWEKFHTIRNNYDLWVKRMAEVQAGRAVIEIYYWDGKPRHKGSKQVVFATLDKYSGCGVQRVYFAINTLELPFIDNFEEKQSLTDVQGIHILNQLAKNDGLLLDDFSAWFKNYDLSMPKAIIQFTNFRY